MKFQIILLFSLALVAVINAQRHNHNCPRCIQGICPARCDGSRNVGIRCGIAPPRRMWYYDINSRSCREMQHLGCGGNANRWCSRETCHQRCVRTLG